MRINQSKTNWSKLSLGLAVAFCFMAFIAVGCSLTNKNNSDSGSSGSLKPSVPTGLLLTSTSASQIALSWNDVADENGYYIERRVPPSSTYNRIATLPANATTYSNSGLSASTIYYYRVKAYNYAGESNASDIVGSLTSWNTTLLDGTTPPPRTDHSAIWTGTDMIVWGGWDGQTTLNTGYKYNTGSNTWTPIATTGAPAARKGHSAIWADSKMIVWGGYNTANDSQALDVESNWKVDYTVSATVTASIDTVITKAGTASAKIDVSQAFSQTGSLAAGYFASKNLSSKTNVSFWIRASQHVEPGVLSFLLYEYEFTDEFGINHYTSKTGMNIDTALRQNEWTSIDLPLTGQEGLMDITGAGLATSVDLGIMQIYIDDIVVYGKEESYYNNGGMYDPVSNTWKTITIADVPEARAFHSALWTGSQMIIWGGNSSATVSLNNGGIYDPVVDKWETTSQKSNFINGTHPNNPTARSRHLAAWTGSGTEAWNNKMIIWGGKGGDNSGGIYDISNDTWSDMDITNAPLERWGFAWVWTGGTGVQTWKNKIIVWGGDNGTNALSDGAIYDPKTNTWTGLPVAPTNLSARMYHTAVWTGT